MGRKAKKLTEQQKSEVETLAAVLTSDQIADYLGIGRTTFYKMMNEDPDIDERYKRGRAKALLSVSKNLIYQAREGNLTAQIFYLKTQGGWRERAPIETPLSNGGRVSNVDLSKASDEQLAQLEALMIKIKLQGGNEPES